MQIKLLREPHFREKVIYIEATTPNNEYAKLVIFNRVTNARSILSNAKQDDIFEVICHPEKSKTTGETQFIVEAISRKLTENEERIQLVQESLDLAKKRLANYEKYRNNGDDSVLKLIDECRVEISRFEAALVTLGAHS